ncbi:host specificity protein, partial [Escherichia fergusonii]|nr:host specificity protein [Escherichia fergusonii]
FRGAKHRQASTNSEYYSSCRLVVKKNGSVIYDKSTNDVTAIYTGIMDMPAGSGGITLEFSVSASNGNYYPSATISDLLVVIMKKSTAGISIS